MSEAPKGTSYNYEGGAMVKFFSTVRYTKMKTRLTLFFVTGI